MREETEHEVDDSTFDRVIRNGVRGVPRRGLLGLVSGFAALATGTPGAEGTRKRRKKCKTPRIRCGKQCLAAGACCTSADCTSVFGQVCVANVCQCPVGGCPPNRAFGCVATQNACLEAASAVCPNSTTSRASCFIDGQGESICGTALCTNVTTDAECESEAGEGAFVLPCSSCASTGNARVCVQPVKK